MTALLELVEVTKSFGDFVAVKDISLAVAPGEVVALLGHNGAGKTVTVRMVSTLAWPTSGQVRVEGYDTRRDAVEIRRRIGVCLDQPLVWPDLTGHQLLRLLAEAYEIEAEATMRRAGGVLDRLRLVIPRDKPVGEYSLGMQRKLGLAASLIHGPRVILWDEPEIGLDAPSRVALKELVLDLRTEGHAVVITTHAVELADAVADRVAVLSQGRLVACDTPSGIRALRGKEESLERAFMALIEEGYLSAPEGASA